MYLQQEYVILFFISPVIGNKHCRFSHVIPFGHVWRHIWPELQIRIRERRELVGRIVGHKAEFTKCNKRHNNHNVGDDGKNPQREASMSAQSSDQSQSLDQAIQQALREWHRRNVTASPLCRLLLYRKALRASGQHVHKATNQVLYDALTRLSKNNAEAANLLQARFQDKEQVYALSNRLNLAESTIYALQKDAILELADVLEQMEQEAQQRQRLMLGERLMGQNYSELVGIEEPLALLLELLTDADAPTIISIEGLGGIGKTTLADALLRRVIAQGLFDEIGWVTARQAELTLSGEIETIEAPVLTAEALVEKLAKQLMPEVMAAANLTTEKVLSLLEARLQETPHLIVIDNLETVVDVRALLPTLRRLANPTRFLLTSRKKLYAEPGIYHFDAPGLDQEAALTLIRQEARVSNLPVLAESPVETLRPIFEVVGGNPLAIRLVVGLSHIHPLNVILDDLLAARGETSDSLYSFIYRKAWENLDELSRQALIAMPLVHERGDTLEFLADVSNIALEELRAGLNKLVIFNLINVHGELHDRRYSIHNLTRSFLYQQVVLWS